MKTMRFGNDVEMSFWGNVDYESNKAALIARNLEAKRLRKAGYDVFCSCITGQWRKYEGFGQPSNMIGTVYKLRYRENER